MLQISELTLHSLREQNPQVTSDQGVYYVARSQQTDLIYSPVRNYQGKSLNWISQSFTLKIQKQISESQPIFFQFWNYDAVSKIVTFQISLEEFRIQQRKQNFEIRSINVHNEYLLVFKFKFSVFGQPRKTKKQPKSTENCRSTKTIKDFHKLDIKKFSKEKNVNRQKSTRTTAPSLRKQSLKSKYNQNSAKPLCKHQKFKSNLLMKKSIKEIEFNSKKRILSDKIKRLQTETVLQ